MKESLSGKFERDGYVLIPGVLEPDTIQALRQLLEPEFERKQTNVLPDAMLEYPQVFDLLSRPKILEVLTALLGRPFAVPPHSSAEYNRFGVFHTDTTGAEMNGKTFPREEGFRMVTVAIYLQDNTDYGGGIRLAPGTHVKPDPYIALTRNKAAQRKVFAQSPLRRALKRLSRGRLFDWDKPFREHPEGVDIPSKAGDVLIWDMRLAHRASPPRRPGGSPQGKKIAVFFTCGVNNSITTSVYLDYALSQPDNAFLKKYRAAESGLPTTADFIVF